MRGHKHIRQKHPHANALTLNCDLIGPWKPGEDHLHTKPVKRLLVATLGVPVYKDGRPQLLGHGDAGSGGDVPFPEDWEEDAHDEDDAPDAEWCEEGVGDEEEPPELSADDFEAAKRRGEERWKKISEELREPVKVHNITFVEPLRSKKGHEVLCAIQKIYTEIRLLNLAVRRIHSDQGREFANKPLERWAQSRDIAVTFSVPSDPKSNGRVEGQVGMVKNGIRALLRSAPHLPVKTWPHAARQWAAQRFERSMKILGGPQRKRRLVPFGTKVTCKQREWSVKTPHAAKATHGIAVCPASQVYGATIVRILQSATEGEGEQAVRLYAAPVTYPAVKQPVQFVGEEVHQPPTPEEPPDDLPEQPPTEEPPGAPPNFPAPKRRVPHKATVATCAAGGESRSCRVCESNLMVDEEGACMICGLWQDPGVQSGSGITNAEMVRSLPIVPKGAVEEALGPGEVEHLGVNTPS